MRLIVPVLVAVLVSLGCEREPSGSAAGPAATTKASSEVVLYSSIDEPYLRPLTKRFETETGIRVRTVTDTEAMKSAGLAERLLAEKDRPQADVFWGNEIFHTINLAQQGVFAAYRPKSAEDIPARWRDAGDLYTGVGLRARMIVVSTRAEAKDMVAQIRGVEDLANPALKGKIGIANPAFGTTSGHFAALNVAWGDERYEKFLRGLRANDAKLLGGNSAVVDQVASGVLLAGMTDNDDINNAKAEGRPVDGVIPDQGEGGIGTLLVPGTVALVKNAPHADAAKQLIDFICKPEVEKELIAGRFLAYSIRDTGKVKAMEVDYARCARQMKKATETALTILQSR